MTNPHIPSSTFRLKVLKQYKIQLRSFLQNNSLSFCVSRGTCGREYTYFRKRTTLYTGNTNRADITSQCPNFLRREMPINSTVKRNILVVKFRTTKHNVMFTFYVQSLQWPVRRDFSLLKHGDTNWRSVRLNQACSLQFNRFCDDRFTNPVSKAF
jgi:hypothetical protein